MAVTQVRAQINGTWHTLALDSATGKYIADLTLSAVGTFPATVEATSNIAGTVTLSGSEYPGLRLVVEDTAAPTLTITSPENNLVTAAGTVTVSGTAFDTSGIASVTVNGTAVAVAANGSFSATVNLSGGSNTITVTATDEAGNVTTDTRTVARATHGPSLTIVSPVAGFITNENSVLVTGSVSDSVSPVASVTVNGVAALLSGGEFSATASLAEGANTITVVATNSVGLTTTKTVSVTMDTVPPVITLTAPMAGQMVGNAAFTVTGAVSDEHLSGVAVNGTEATVTGDTFSVEITLAEGANAITATASDTAGNTASATGSVLLDTLPPMLTVVSPAGDLITNQPTFTVAGTASDNGSEVDTVAVNGTTVTLTDGAYSTDLTLSEGTNTVTVTAADKVGNMTIVTRSILLDTAPPVLTLVSPPAGYLDTSTPTVIFSVVDEPGGSGVDLDTVVVLVDGTSHAAAVADGTITITPTLTDGAHVITVTVEDRAGNRHGLSASYTVDTVPPAMYLQMPYMRHIVDDEHMEIVVDAYDGGTGVASVTAGNYTLTGTGPFKGTVPLDVGENTITVTAADYAGNQTAAQVYIIRLITDRTKADVAVLEDLYRREGGAASWTEAELEWFNTAIVKGAYNAEDLNRVGVAVRWLAGELTRRGYIASVSAKTDWSETDAPTVSDLDTYLRNVETVRSAQGLYVPNIPYTMRKSTVEDWNKVEKALVETDAYFPDYFAWTAGEITAGGF